MNDSDDATARAHRVVMTGLAVMERRMDELAGKEKLTPQETTRLIVLTEKSAQLMGHLRRYDREQREAAGRLTPSVVRDYLRELEPGRLEALLADLGIETAGGSEGEDGWGAPANGRSVLS